MTLDGDDLSRPKTTAGFPAMWMCGGVGWVGGWEEEEGCKCAGLLQVVQYKKSANLNGKKVC